MFDFGKFRESMQKCFNTRWKDQEATNVADMLTRVVNHLGCSAGEAYTLVTQCSELFEAGATQDELNERFNEVVASFKR